MSPIALVTGSTDGLGRATALELAKRGYTVHVLGRNEARGRSTLEALRAGSPDRPHELFLVDLAAVRSTLEFLDAYTDRHSALDLLVLNANAVMKPLRLTDDGIEATFAIGYVSRYLFSLKLDRLLRASAGPRVVHVGDGRYVATLDDRLVRTAKHGAFKATAQAYAADCYLAHFVNALELTPVPHEIFYPGMVNTRQVKDLNVVLRVLARLAGLQEPEEAAVKLVDHVQSTSPSDLAGGLTNLGRPKRFPRKLIDGKARFEQLIAFSEEVTQVALSDHL